MVWRHPLAGAHKPDTRDLPKRLLRPSSNGSNDNHKATDDEEPSVHELTTLSAAARIEGGIVRPRAFAGLMLIASSNFVGCSTGKSAGLAHMRTATGPDQFGRQEKSRRPVRPSRATRGLY